MMKKRTRVSALAVFGGALIGVRSGVLLPLVVGLGHFISTPSASTLGYAHVSSLIGGAVGLALGAAAGAMISLVLALSWRIGLRPRAVLIAGVLAVTAMAIVMIVPLSEVPFDPLWAAVVGLGAVEGCAGLVLIVWISEL
ncbi:hypothetical protein [Herbiconiux liukaitaii]|uniref:hypothetical protein n=1 Tax=Herbiconiux liukaitaii TaxID=3342799 RepID=UPI0035B8B91A